MPDKYTDLMKMISIGGMGAATHYFYQFINGGGFEISKFIANVFVGCYIAWLIGELFDPNDWYRSPAAGFAAITSVKIVELIENKGTQIEHLISDKVDLLIKVLMRLK